MVARQAASGEIRCVDEFLSFLGLGVDVGVNWDTK